MASRDIDRLLKEASRTPLGPFALACDAAGANAWTLTATWLRLNAPAEIRAAYDPATDALHLDREVSTNLPFARVDEIITGRSSIVEAAPTSWNTVAIRLWLRGEGLTPMALLTAVAELARLGLVLQETPERTATVSPEAPPPPAKPEPEPIIDASRRPGWQQLAANAASAPARAPAPPSPSAEQQLPQSISPPPAAAAAPAASAAGPPPAGTTGFCRECGAPYSEQHVFCINCGARLTA